MVFSFCIFSALFLAIHGHLRSESQRAIRNSLLGAISTTKRVQEYEYNHFPVYGIPIQPTDQSCDSLEQIPKFVINADKSSLRYAQFSETVQRMGMGDVCRVQADLVENCHQTFENVCGSSHRKIWRYMDEQNIPLALVMEDDALGTVSPEFCGYMNYLRNEMSSNGSIDVARLHTFATTRRDCSARQEQRGEDHHCIRNRRRTDPNMNQSHVSRRLVQNCPKYGTSGYLITLRGARASLESWKPRSNSSYFPVDHYHNYRAVQQNKMTVKCVFPPLFEVQQTSSYKSQPNEPHRLSQDDEDASALYSIEEKYSKLPKLPKLPVASPKFVNASNSGDVSSRAILMDDAKRLPDCVDPLLVQQCREFR